MPEIIDASHFTALSKADPAVLCRHNRASYNATDKSYTLTLWTDTFRIVPAEQRIDRVAGTGPPPHDYYLLFLLYWLLQMQDEPPSGEWISEKDPPGGATFFQGPHLVPTRQVAEKWENDLEPFAARCRELRGEPIAMGDSAFRFAITPDLPVAAVYWLGDEDFGPEAKILYDRVLAKVPLDILFALAVGICHKLS